MSDPMGELGARVESEVRAILEAAHLRGAPPREVSQALVAMTARASAELARLAPSDDARRDAMGVWLAAIAPHEVAKYAAAHAEVNAPAPPKKVASVFANAARTSKQVPWADAKGEASVVLACPSCGAPQERALDFQCRYCRSALEVETRSLKR